MVELAEIFRQHGPSYRAKYGQRMLPSHLKVMEAIEQCRTQSLGGEVYYCNKCSEYRYSYHSCKNRHCSKCQNDQANQWLDKQRGKLLPVVHFMVTFTLPDELRSLAGSNQKIIYDLLFRASAAALQKLALDPRFVGGRIGMVGVLHTWTRDLKQLHPHIHYLVPGGGLTQDGEWVISRDNFLVDVEALGIIFRAKFRDELKRTVLFEKVKPAVWNKSWVVHCEPVGTGEAALKYLAPYIFRVAISNSRIVSLEHGNVTFKYKESATDHVRYSSVTAEEFIRRFLQHVLPDHFVKVRYYGLLSTSNRRVLDKAREILAVDLDNSDNEKEQAAENKREHQKAVSLQCPNCGTLMKRVGQLGRSPP